jgi:hypothetical protein
LGWHACSYSTKKRLREYLSDSPQQILNASYMTLGLFQVMPELVSKLTIHGVHDSWYVIGRLRSEGRRLTRSAVPARNLYVIGKPLHHGAPFQGPK